MRGVVGVDAKRVRPLTLITISVAIIDVGICVHVTPESELVAIALCREPETTVTHDASIK